MKKQTLSLLATVATLTLATPASATPQAPGFTNAGQCAGPVGSRCRYTLEIVNPAEPMVVVPGLEFVGPSRLSTVEFCAGEVGVDNAFELITDAEFEGMEACLVEHT
jgi:hypothetical protein